MAVVVNFPADIRNWLIAQIERGIPQEAIARQLEAQNVPVTLAQGIVTTVARAVAAGEPPEAGRLSVEETPVAETPYRPDAPLRLAGANTHEVDGREVAVLAHLERPALAVLANVLGHDECDDLIELARPRLAPTRAAGDCSATQINPNITRGDNYVDLLVKKIQASPLWANKNKRVAIVITFDEGNGNYTGPASCCGWNSGAAVNGQVGEPATVGQPIAGYSGGNKGDGPIIFGVLTNQPTAPVGVIDPDQYSHFSFVRTMQDMFGLSDPGVPTSYMNRSKYTQSFIAANLTLLPEFQGSLDPHFDAVRPMASVFALK